MNITLTTATPDYLPALVTLADNRQAEDTRSHVMRVPVDPQAAAKALAQVLQFNLSLVALNEDEQVIGAMVLMPSADWWNPKFGFITDFLFHVPSNYRGTHAVTELIKAGKKIAENAGLPLRLTSLHVEKLGFMTHYYAERGFNPVGGAWQYMPPALEQFLPADQGEAA